MTREQLEALLPDKKNCARHYNQSPNICDCGAKGWNQYCDEAREALLKADLCRIPGEDELLEVLWDNIVFESGDDIRLATAIIGLIKKEG